VIRQFEIIGEAVKTLPAELMAKEASIPADLQFSAFQYFRFLMSHDVSFGLIRRALTLNCCLL